MRYYIRINFLPEPRDNAFLAGRCIQILHGVIRSHSDTNIALSFPEWSEASIGSAIAFISPFPEQLSVLISQTYFKRMEHLRYFDIQPLKAIINEGEQVIFVRNQSIDQGTVMGARRRIRRLVKRAEQRGSSYQPSCKNYTYCFNCYHQIPIISKGTGQSFSLYIEQKDAMELVLGSINSYGLSVKKKSPVSVPRQLP